MSGVNCREYEMVLMDLARRRSVDPEARVSLAGHVESCGRCRHLLDSQIRLSAAAGAVADDASRWKAPFRVEQAVMAEARAVQVPRRRRFIFGMAGAAIAASLVLVWAANRTAPTPAPRKAVNVAESAPKDELKNQVISTRVVTEKKVVSKRLTTPLTPVAPEQQFIAIPYTMPLQPYEHADVIRMDVPVTALIAAGLPVGIGDPTARAQTDVLVGQDGQARAVRLISISMVSYQGVSQR